MTIMATKRRVLIENEEISENDSKTDSDSETEIEEDQQSTSNDEVNQDDDDDGSTANVGWADSISKILKANKPKGKKTLVLSKAKKLTDVRKTKTKDAGFEVEAKDGQIKREHVEESDSTDEDKADRPLRKKKKELPSLRVKPNILDKDRERTLSKIATKGVVQLFNAVKQQQKDIDTKLKNAGPLEVKRDKVLKSIDKREFLNVLMGDKSQSNKQVSEATVQNKNKVSETEPTWSVLKDDFMMGAKMKDWDKELENEEEDEVEAEVMESE